MKMYPTDWRARVFTAVVVMVCMLAAMNLGPAVGLNGFWLGELSILAAVLVGIVLGNRVGRLLFPPSADGQSDLPPKK